MKILKSFQELVDLELYETVYIIQEFHITSYKKAGFRSEKRELVILSSNTNNMKAICISRFNFTNDSIFLSGEYNSNIVGELLISRLNQEIKTIKEVYLTKTNI